MGLAIEAGLSLNDFYRAETWEVSVIIDNHLRSKSADYKLKWELARFQMSAMTDVSTIKFPWEKKHLHVKKDEWQSHLNQMENWKQKATNGRN